MNGFEGNRDKRSTLTGTGVMVGSKTHLNAKQ